MVNMTRRHIIHILCSPHGGIATYVQGLIESEAKKKNYSTLFLNIRKADTNLISNLKELKNSERINKLYNLHTHKLPKIKTIFDTIKLISIIKKYKYDKQNKLFLCAHGTSSAGIALFASIFTGIKLIYIPHGGLSHLYSSKNKFLYSLVNLFDNILTTFNVKFVYESKYTSKVYNIVGKSKSNIHNSNNYLYSFTNYTHKQIKNNFYVDDFNPTNAGTDINNIRQANQAKSISEKTFIEIIYLGTWRKIKGPIRLLNVLSTFEKSDFRLKNQKLLKFSFYTDKKVIDIKNPHPEYISINGWSNNTIKIISNASGQIIPSEGESFGYAAIEAQVSFLPVIHTNQGGLKEIFEGTNFPIIPTKFTKHDLLEAIEFLTNNSFEEMIKGGVFLKSSIINSAWNTDKMNYIFK